MNTNHPPPPPPPHGNHSHSSSNAGPGSGGLPPGNYDIFVIPPHSSGSGFLYLPSLQPHRNSFLAGVFCTLAAIGVWVLAIPVIKQWTATLMSSGGSGLLLTIVGVAVLGWAMGKTQVEMSGGSKKPDSGPNPSAHTTPDPDPTGGPYASGPNFGNSQQRPNWQQQSQPNPSPNANWEKAREEMRKREEERKKKEEAERKAEKERWERSRQREREAREKEAREQDARTKEQREKEVREKLFQERLKKERESREAREREAREAKEREAKAKASSAAGNYQRPTAQSYAASEDAYSYRPYDQPKSSPTKMGTNSSYVSDSTSYTGSQSTARTTPPPSQRGTYVNKDPNKVTIRGVFAFTDTFKKPMAQLVVGQNRVTEGLVLKITTEGMFVDDDVRGVGQREWDLKAYNMKLIEEPSERVIRGKHMLRISMRDTENKNENRKYVFILDESESWKVAVGIQRLRKGTQVRSLGFGSLKGNKMAEILESVDM